MGDEFAVHFPYLQIRLEGATMNDISKSLSKAFATSGDSQISHCDANVLASLMLQSNALVSLETSVQLCSLSIQDINFRIREGRFPPPQNLSLDSRETKLAFRVRDIQKWLNSPSEYYASQSSIKDKGFNMSYD